MTCRKHQSQLSAYLDGRLEPEARAALEADLSECPACRQTLHLMTRAGQILASQPAAAPPPGLAERATRHALTADRAPSSGFLDGWFQVAWPTAALATVATVLLLFLAHPAPATPSPADSNDPLGILVSDDAPADPVAGQVLALEVTP